MDEPITCLYEVTQGFLFKTDLLMYVFIGELFFCLSCVTIKIPYDNTGALIFFLITIFLSSDRDLITFHSSLDKLECLTDLSIAVESSSSILLRKRSKCGSPLGGFQDVLVRDAEFFTKI